MLLAIDSCERARAKRSGGGREGSLKSTTLGRLSCASVEVNVEIVQSTLIQARHIPKLPIEYIFAASIQIIEWVAKKSVPVTQYPIVRATLSAEEGNGWE
jgi:hypothetical protein